MERSIHPLPSITTLILALLLAACGGDQDAGMNGLDTTGTVGMADTAMTDPMAADPAAMAAAGEKINVNEATEEEFRQIPNVGDNMIGEFQEYRPYVSIQQFRREIGKYVDEQQVAEYERYLYVPVDPNESDVATLQQIPGVNAAVAAELANGRPYASNQEFIDALAEHIAQDQVAVAERYLAAE